jgi:hypothetical protein
MKTSKIKGKMLEFKTILTLPNETTLTNTITRLIISISIRNNHTLYMKILKFNTTVNNDIFTII